MSDWLLLFWVGCGIISYGLIFSYFMEEKFQETSTWFCVFAAFVMFLYGIPGLLVAYFATEFGKHGMRFFPSHKKH